MSEPDDLFTLRNHFWLGSYQLAIAEGSGLGRLSDSLRIERDEFIYRSYVALGQYSIVLDEVRSRVHFPGRLDGDVGMSCWQSKWTHTEQLNSGPRPNWYQYYIVTPWYNTYCLCSSTSRYQVTESAWRPGHAEV